MRILVTGCAGFIGYHVSRALLGRGDDVVGIDNLNDYYDVSLKEARLKELDPFTGCHPEPFDSTPFVLSLSKDERDLAQGKLREGSRGYRDSSSSTQNDTQVTGHRSQVTAHETPVTCHLSRVTGPGRFTFIKLDISDLLAMETLFSKHQFDRVIHLAAQAGVRYSLENPHAYVRSNVVGFLNVLECCRRQLSGRRDDGTTGQRNDGTTGQRDNGTTGEQNDGTASSRGPVVPSSRGFMVPSSRFHLVYASSSSVYGLNTKLPFSVTDNVDHPISLYAATKRADELMAYTYSHLYGIPMTGLRFFTVYGPWGRPDMAYFKFTKAIAEGRPIDVYNDGKMRRDFTYIDDIVEGVLRVCDHVPGPRDNVTTGQRNDGTTGQRDNGTTGEQNDGPTSSRRPVVPSSRDFMVPSSRRPVVPGFYGPVVPYRLYNIGNHSPVDLMDFIKSIESSLGKKAKINYMPMQPGDVLETYADVGDLMQDVGFKPDTPVDQGIARFIEWYRQYYS